MDDLLKQAIWTIKSGDIARGKKLLIQILEQDSKNELAWLWMSKCVTKKEQKIDCLNRVLEINPHNETAQQEIRRIITLDSIKQSSEPKTTPTPKVPPKQIKAQNKKTPWLIYVVSGFLLILFGCQMISFISSIVQRSQNLTYEFVTIPSGEFWMGSGRENAHIHKVYVNSFEMGKFEVTNAQYKRCVSAGKCQPPKLINVESNDSRYLDPNYRDSKYANHPVVRVSWMQARDFCKYIDARLPTEPEWEYAARGGLEKKKYPWGDEEPICDTSAKNGANFDEKSLRQYDKNCPNTTMKVGSFLPNAYGLYDMFGNVAEWTFDWYDVYPGGDPTVSGEFGRQFKVIRGGSWTYGYIYKSEGIATRNYVMLNNIPIGEHKAGIKHASHGDFA